MKRMMLVLITTGVLAAPAGAYEKPLHRVITSHAFQYAAVPLELRLGIEYHEAIGTPAMLPRDWVLYGSVREDDIHESIPPARSVNHFLDPAHNAPLTVGLFPACINGVVIGGNLVSTERADDWALNYPSQNIWSLGDAREYQYKALFGLTPEERKHAAADTMRAVGHMLHLVEDMAQPEHTRNDQHLLALGGATAPSLYEEWSLENLVTRPRPDARYFFFGYPTVKLERLRDYFVQGVGKGLAEYSNRNYVTQDTNYDDFSAADCFTYGVPSILGATGRLEYVAVPVAQPGGPTKIVNVLETVFESRPVDLYRGVTEVDSYHTTYSVFDAEVQRYDPSRHVYSLNDQSYYSRAQKLVPRAVGYASGFMKHFFGGSLDVRWVPSDRTGQVYEVTITNRSGRTIPGHAELKLAYRPGPANLGTTTTRDTAHVLSGRLSDLTRAVALPHESQVTLRDVRPPFLPVGDIATEFETVAMLREHGSPDETITSTVERAGISSTLQFEVTWPTSLPSAETPTLTVLYCQISLAGACTRYIVAGTGSGTTSFNVPTGSVSRSAMPITVRIESTVPGYAYGFYLSTRSDSTPVTIRAIKNGTVVLSQQLDLPRFESLTGHLLWEAPAEFR